MTEKEILDLCPCGSGVCYQKCCAPYLEGKKVVTDTPVNVLRTRFTAYAKANGEYILSSWHRDYRPKQKAKYLSLEAKSCKFTKLEIIKTNINNDIAEIEYIARFRQGTNFGYMHELANFKMVNGQWFYTDGQMQP